MNIKTFNTGRGYTENGQRIAYTYVEAEKVIYFYDIDRYIDAVIPIARYDENNDYQQFIMANYDVGNDYPPSRDLVLTLRDELYKVAGNM